MTKKGERTLKDCLLVAAGAVGFWLLGKLGIIAAISAFFA